MQNFLPVYPMQSRLETPKARLWSSRYRCAGQIEGNCHGLGEEAMAKHPKKSRIFIV
jgi:hypothetical protein